MAEININGKIIKTDKNKTILEAASDNGIHIPHLCYEKRLSPAGACRLCQVHVGGVDKEPVLACSTKVADGMNIATESDELSSRRKAILELLLSEHRIGCTNCDSEGKCKLQDYAYRYGADEFLFGSYQRKDEPTLNYTSDNKGIEHDSDRSIPDRN